MNAKLILQDPAALATPLLAVFAIDIATTPGDEPSPALLTTSDALANAVTPWLGTGDFKASLAETLLLHAPSGIAARRLLVIGLGPVARLSVHQLRKAAGVAIRQARARSLRSLALVFPEDRALADEHLDTLPCDLTSRALIEGAVLADFDIDFYRADRRPLALEELLMVHREPEKRAVEELQLGLREGIIVAESQNFARTLINEPGNVLTPTELGRRAAAMAAQTGLQCEVHSTDKLRELKMGAFLAVSQGSPQPPALIVLRYEPRQPLPPDAPVLGLVGKGITFDTGGISIKPAADMDKMKYDMAGAAAMLGAMRALALLQPAVRLLAVICSCENMPDGLAFKPGDVVTAMSGATIEILNTDAEGRLVLADGLHYAQTLGATHLVDAATLTGAISVALGQLNAGLFSNSNEAASRFLDASCNTGEPFWRLPCTDDYRDQIKSSIADIQNTGGSRYGGAITAAMFLKHFVGETPWLHLDIAGTTWLDDPRPWQSKGPSGIAVRTITEWARSFAAPPGSSAS